MFVCMRRKGVLGSSWMQSTGSCVRSILLPWLIPLSSLPLMSAYPFAVVQLVPGKFEISKPSTILCSEHPTHLFQPAIDAYTFYLMREFNALPQLHTRAEASPRGLGMTRQSKAPSDKIDNYKEAGGVQPLVYATFQAYLRR